MLKLHERGATEFNAGRVADLDLAEEVSIERQINDIYSIYFKYPANDMKAPLIENDMLISYKGEGYVIRKISRVTDGTDMLQITAADLFSCYGRSKHIQNIPDMIGKPPSDVFEYVIRDTPFTAFTEAELNARGMTWFDSDGYKIDFFSTDKTNVWDATQTIIENAGRGEVYRENFKVAIVKQLGRDNGVRITLEKNAQNLTIMRDTDNLITRLYPYGADDMHIGSLSKELVSTESQRLKFYARAMVAHRPRSPTTAGVIDASGCDCEDFIIFIIIEKIIKFSG